MTFWFWFFVAPAIVLAFLSLRGERKRARYVASRLDQSSAAALPRAAVIVPVKGAEEGLRDNLASLAAQDYPDYELIVSARSAADIPPDVLPGGIKIVLGGKDDPGASEKIRNLIAAIELASRSSEIFAFADSDGRVGRGWLRALVAPLAEDGVGASTGYRWYLPQPPDFWSLVRSVWNAAIASTLGPGDNAFAWGGSMAIRRELLFELRIPQYWKAWISDDYALSAAVHAAGLRIAFAPGAMAATTDHIAARKFFGWARRQMLLTRIYHPRLWWRGLAAHFFYCGGMAAAVAASILGNRLAEWALLLQLGPGLLKGTNRAVLAKAELPEFKTWFDRHGWVHTWWVPLATWIWLATLAAAAFGNTVVWRGVRYALRRPHPDSEKI